MRQIAVLGAMFALLLGLADALLAQSATGQITGTVRDATAAVAVGAPVTVSRTERPCASASCTARSVALKSYEPLPGFAGSGGGVAPARTDQNTCSRTIPAPDSTVRFSQVARTVGSAEP